MDQEFPIYIVFGMHRIDTDDGRQYVTRPLFVSHSLAQAQYEWQLSEKHREWIPEGGVYVNCAVAIRNIPLYPDVG